jgi:thioredoxin-like negative regulator of GroEL
VVEALERNDEERALELVLDAIPSALPDRREQLRYLAVAVFEYLGHDDPVTVTYRRRLATVLY